MPTPVTERCEIDALTVSASARPRALGPGATTDTHIRGAGADDAPHSAARRSPVMVLWGAVVGRVCGYGWEEALSLASAVAALNAAAKGVSLGLYTEEEERAGAGQNAGAMEETVRFLGREVPAVRTTRAPPGLRGLQQGREVIPGAVYRYVAKGFGPHLGAVHDAFTALAEAIGKRTLASEGGRHAYETYVRIRPDIPKGQAGWGATGNLDLALVYRIEGEYASLPQEDEEFAAEGHEAWLEALGTFVLDAVSRKGAEGLFTPSLAQDCIYKGYREDQIRNAIVELQLEGCIYEKGGCLYPL